MVTFIPIGRFNLLPLHAVGEPGDPGDRATHWRRLGHFSAIRYAPNARALRRCRDRAEQIDGHDRTLLAADAGDLRYAARATAHCCSPTAHCCSPTARSRWPSSARP